MREREERRGMERGKEGQGKGGRKGGGRAERERECVRPLDGQDRKKA